MNTDFINRQAHLLVEVFGVNPPEARELFEGSLRAAERDIQWIESDLAVHVLDGTPYILFLEKDGRRFVYGNTGRALNPNEGGEPGFFSQDLVEGHLGGLHLFGKATVARKTANASWVRKAFAGGFLEDATPGYIHRNDFQRERLADHQEKRATYALALELLDQEGAAK